MDLVFQSWWSNNWNYMKSTRCLFQARLLNLDPAKIAGPMETAFQDVVGQSFLLGVSYLIFSVTEDRLHALHFWLLDNDDDVKVHDFMFHISGCMSTKKTNCNVTLLVSTQELWNKIFGFLLDNIRGEPLGHDVIVLLPVLNNFFKILLALKQQQIQS